MKPHIKSYSGKFIILAVLMIAGLLLVACSSKTQEDPIVKTEDQSTEIVNSLPEPENDKIDGKDTDVAAKVYPNTEQATQNQEIDELPQETAYPEPEAEIVAKVETVEPSNNAYPAPQEEPVQEIKPTPRGNELVATNPSHVNLASGQLQLIELFAFW